MSGNPNHLHQSTLYSNEGSLYLGIKFQKSLGNSIATPGESIETRSSEKVAPIGREPHPTQAQRMENNNQISL
jgi:hypothetical protein